MSALGSAGMNAAHVEFAPSGEPGQYLYIPRVLPETTPDGSPAFVLLKAGAMVLLQAGTRFAEEPARVADALAGLKARQDVPIPIRLDQAPLEVRAARLVLAEGDKEIAKVTTSGVPPYGALFHVALNEDQAAAVEAALGGTRGKLKAVYDFDLSEKAGALATFDGDTSSAAAELGPAATDADAAAWMDRAVAAGMLKFNAAKWGPEADALLATATGTAKMKAIAFLVSMAAAGAPPGSEQTNKVLSTVRLEEPRSVPATRAADVGDWFPAGKHATVLSAAGLAAAPGETSGSGAVAAVTVKLGFDDKDAPIAFIEVRGEGGRVAVLRAPAWQPAVVNSAGKVALTVHYTTSAPALETTIDVTGDERTLAMEELGIALIRVDASARKAAGATQWSGTVKYLRGGEEIDSWPVRFRFGEWTDQWYVVTAAPGWNGSLEYRWQETQPDGSTTAGGPVTTDRPEIRIA